MRSTQPISRRLNPFAGVFSAALGGLFIGLTFCGWYLLRGSLPYNVMVGITIAAGVVWSLIIQRSSGCRSCAGLIIGASVGFGLLVVLILTYGDQLTGDEETNSHFNLILSTTVVALNVAITFLRRARNRVLRR